MKKQTSVYLKILVVCVCFSLVLVAVFGASVSIRPRAVQEIQENIPYISDDAPEFFGILIRFKGAKSVYFGFNKAEHKTIVIMLPNSAEAKEVTEYGYDIDCQADASFDFLARLIDNFGGIELNTGTDGVFKYTGVQITEMLTKTNDDTFKKTVISKVLYNMKHQGLNRADLVMLIEGTDTDLTFPSAYYLHDTINSALNSLTFVN